MYTLMCSKIKKKTVKGEWGSSHHTWKTLSPGSGSVCGVGVLELKEKVR